MFFRTVYEGTPASLLPAVTTLTRVFLDPDPEKVSAMRRGGVSREKACSLSDYQRLLAFASCPDGKEGTLAGKIARELRYFGYEGTFSPENVARLWEETKDAFLPFDPSPLLPEGGEFAVLTDPSSDPCLAGGFCPAIDLTPYFGFSERGFGKRTERFAGGGFEEYAAYLRGRIGVFAGNGCDTAVLRLPRLPLDLRAEEGDLNGLFRTAVLRDGCATDADACEKLRTALLLRLCAALREHRTALHLRFGAEEKEGMLLPLPDAGKIYEAAFLLEKRGILPALLLCPESAYALEASIALSALLPLKIASDDPAVPVSVREEKAVRRGYASPLVFLK